MVKPEKLSVFQAVMLLIVSRITIAYTYLPIISTPPANRDVWLVVIAAFFYDLVLCFPLLYLGNKFPGLSLLQYSERIIGKFLTKIFGLMLVGFFTFFNLMFLVLNTGFLGAAVMPETPIQVTMIILVLTTLYTAFKGLILHGRMSGIFTTLILASIVLFTVLSTNHMSFHVFFPILKATTFRDFNFGAWSAANLFYQIIILGIIAPDIEGKNNINKVFLYTLSIFTVFYTIIVVSCYSVLGVRLSQKANFPYFSVIRQIALFGFIERIESINIIGWFVGIFLNFSLHLYISSVILAHTFKTKTSKIFIIPLAVIILIIAFTTNITKAVIFTWLLSYKFLPYLQFVSIFIIPVILLIIYFIRRKTLKPVNEMQE